MKYKLFLVILVILSACSRTSDKESNTLSDSASQDSATALTSAHKGPNTSADISSDSLPATDVDYESHFKLESYLTDKPINDSTIETMTSTAPF